MRDLTPQPLPYEGRGSLASPRRGGAGGGARKETTIPTRHIITGQKIGPSKLQRAKALRRNMCPAERHLWAVLRANRLEGFHFSRQQIMDGFIVDFYCHAAGLVVEVDAPIHEQQGDYDANRDEVLANRGLQVLRFTNEQVMTNLEKVLSRIAAMCQEKAAEK